MSTKTSQPAAVSLETLVEPSIREDFDILAVAAGCTQGPHNKPNRSAYLTKLVLADIAAKSDVISKAKSNAPKKKK